MSEFQTPAKKTSKVDDEIVIPPSPFLNRLGYGTGVSVMQLVRSPKAGQIRSPWALKMLNKRVKPNKVYTERIQAEADLLQRMSHPNIVGFRAFSKSKILYLGMEACDLSLGDMIEKRVENGNFDPFLPQQILRVALDISRALDYLHTKMQILHGDIKSYNILVNGDFIICKLCDFGVTLPLDENGIFDKDKAGNAVYYGTEAWSAPEVLHGGIISNKTDIFALGLTFWEMLALAPPHSLEETFNDSGTSDDSMEYSNRFGAAPAVPAGVSEQRHGAALLLLRACTAPAPARPAAPAVPAGVSEQRHGAALLLLRACTAPAPARPARPAAPAVPAGVSEQRHGAALLLLRACTAPAPARPAAPALAALAARLLAREQAPRR